MPTPQNTKTVTDMRENAIGLLKDVQKLGLVYLFQHSDPKAVVLSLDQFNKIQEMIEDFNDALTAEKILTSPKTKFVPLEKFWKKYKLDE